MNTEQSVTGELHELNSPLARLPRRMPYTVPEGYFEALTAETVHAVKTNAAVPDGYFEALPVTMLHVAKSAAAASSPLPRPKPKVPALQPMRWAAAAILLISFAIGGGLFFRNAQSPEYAVSSLPADAVNAYVEANLTEVDADLLAESTVASLNAPDLTGLTAEDLEDYLAESGWVE